VGITKPTLPVKRVIYSPVVPRALGRIGRHLGRRPPALPQGQLQVTQEGAKPVVRLERQNCALRWQPLRPRVEALERGCASAQAT